MYVEAWILQIQVFEMKQLWGCLNRGFSNDERKMDLVAKRCATARRGASVALPKTDRGNSRFLSEVESLVR